MIRIGPTVTSSSVKLRHNLLTVIWTDMLRNRSPFAAVFICIMPYASYATRPLNVAWRAFMHDDVVCYLLIIHGRQLYFLVFKLVLCYACTRLDVQIIIYNFIIFYLSLEVQLYRFAIVKCLQANSFVISNRFSITFFNGQNQWCSHDMTSWDSADSRLPVFEAELRRARLLINVSRAETQISRTTSLVCKTENARRFIAFRSRSWSASSEWRHPITPE